MLNSVKVKDFELWDAETGEADITALFENGVSLKAFTLDHFEKDEEIDVLVSLFCNEFQLTGEETKPFIENIKDNFHAKVQGKIIEVKVDEEEGNILIIDAGGIFVNAYMPEEIEINKNNNYFIGLGRLDIETEIIS